MIPKVHCARVSELSPEYSRALGEAVTKVSLGLTKGSFAASMLCGATDLRATRDSALENTALNVVCNQEYAQAVHHVRTFFMIPSNRLNFYDILSMDRSIIILYQLLSSMCLCLTSKARASHQ